LPRITGYRLTGLLIGPSITGFFTRQEVDHFSFIAEIALGIIVSYIGTEFERKEFQRLKRMLLVFSQNDIVFRRIST
jgi:Kef-type K+ transport system membrane component KefB